MNLQTLPDSLATDHKSHFDAHGYCVVDGLWTEEQIQEIQDLFEGYKNIGMTVFDGGSHFDEIDKTKRQVRALHPHRYSDKALEWLINPRVGEVLELLLGKPALVAQSMYYFKPPGARGQNMHQDNMYLLSQPNTCIAAWTAIDDATLETGCLYVVPGSHRDDLICEGEVGAEHWLEYGENHIKKFPRETKPIPVTVLRGQTMFFGGNLIHGSGPNRSKDRSRRTFIGHYADDASNTLAKFYHPVLNMKGEVVSDVAVYEGGGPCGGDWAGGVH